MGNPPFEEVSPIENGGFPLQKVSLPGGSYIYTKLGGGNSQIFRNFTLENWGRFEPILTYAYFSRWVGKKTTNQDSSKKTVLS